MGEIAQQRRAVRRVHDLGMELHAIDAPRIIGDRRERRTVGHRHGAEPGRDAVDAIAVAHPHLLARADRPDAVEQRAIGAHLDEGAAELPLIGRRDLAAQLAQISCSP